MIGSLIALAVAALQPAAPAPPTGLAGVWEGTVGDLPVRVCFVERDWGAYGAYYYRSRLQLIGLEEAVAGRRDAFNERGESGGSVPVWHIDRGPETLGGRWTNGGRTLPLRLHRIAGANGDEGACASLAFHQSRLAGLTTTSSRATLDGIAYTKLVLDNRGRFGIAVQSFALDGDSAAVRRINATLGEPLGGSPPRWFECITNSLSQSPYEGEESETLEPVMISRRWLSVASHADWSCGGAHPDSSNVYRLFDLNSGAELNLLDWFNATAVKRETFEDSEEVAKTLEPAFRTFILANWHPPADSAECEGVVRDQDYWNVGLRRDGLVFTPLLPHVVQACGEEFTIGFDRLRPWLTPEGAANIDALRAE
jgi:hypothetical protein